jgi:hypothetical protein
MLKPEGTPVPTQQPTPTQPPPTQAPLPTQPPSTFTLLPPPPTESPPPPPASVVISFILLDGQVPRVESDEYAQITEQGGSAVNLSGWRFNAGDPGQ